MLFSVKILLSASIIAFSSWLAGKRPELAGFIVALPLTTLLAIAFSYVQYKDSAASVLFAKSIFVGVPVSLLFFVPFLLAGKLRLEFWQCYVIGLLLLTAGYFLHRQIMQWF